MSRLAITLDLPHGRVDVGHVDWVPNRRVAAFQASERFLADPWPISPLRLTPSLRPVLADPAPFEGLHGAFSDSLPDGWGRLLVDRAARARGVPAGGLTPVDRLAIVGRHGMGALTYEPAEDGSGEEAVDLAWFAARAMQIEEGLAVPDLQRIRDLHGGSAGARPKLVAQLNPRTGELLDHRQPLRDGFEHWLIKFRNRTDPAFLPEIEAAYIAMARTAGIEAPEARVLRDAAGRSFFAVKRFDRIGDGRVHMQSAAGLLNLDFRVPSLDYLNLLRLIGGMTRDRSQVAEGVRRMVFNVMAHNRDDHAKNHAFLMREDRSWRLSPVYDVTFSSGPAGEHHLAVENEGRRPTESHLFACGVNAGLSPAAVAEIVAEVREVVANWETFAEDAGVPAGAAREITEVIDSIGLVEVRRRTRVQPRPGEAGQS